MAKAKEVIAEYANGKTFGYMFSALSAATTYADARDQGENFTSAVAAGIRDFVLPEVMGGWAFTAYAIGPAFVGGMVSAYESLGTEMRQNQRSSQTPFSNYTFRDNESYQQMRASGLALAAQAQGINNTRITGRNGQMQETAFGNEARYLHR